MKGRRSRWRGSTAPVDTASARSTGERRLGDVVARVGLDQLARTRRAPSAGVRADQHAVAAGLVRRLDHQLVEIGQHVVAVLRRHAQVGRHVRQDRRPRPGSSGSSPARRRTRPCRRPRRRRARWRAPRCPRCQARIRPGTPSCESGSEHLRVQEHRRRCAGRSRPPAAGRRWCACRRSRRRRRPGRCPRPVRRPCAGRGRRARSRPSCRCRA